MSASLLTPLGALLVLVVLVPLVALRFQRVRSRAVRAAVSLPEPPASTRRAASAALVVAAVLVGTAAAQPRVEWTSTRNVRAGAEAYVVLDNSRSMLARPAPGQPTRFERSRDAALRFRDSVPDVRVGIASFTDRVLPHLFPTADDDVFVATLRRSLAVDRPPPQGSFATTATRLDRLEAVATRKFFSPRTRDRVLVVLTDGESIPVAGARLGRAFRRPPGIQTIFVHVWAADDRVYSGGAIEPQYTPDPRSRSILEGAASTVGGRVFSESELDDALALARRLLREGRLEAAGERRNRIGLAPYLVGAAFLPLGLLLWRRDR